MSPLHFLTFYLVSLFAFTFTDTLHYFYLTFTFEFNDYTYRYVLFSRPVYYTFLIPSMVSFGVFYHC